MAIIEVKVPQLSESVSEATLLDWHKQEGQSVARDENLIDIETDKVVLELPAPADGVLVRIMKKARESAGSGDVIAQIDTEAKAITAAAAPPKPAAAAEPAPKAVQQSAGPTVAASTAGVHAPKVARTLNARAADAHMGAGQNVALMVVGGAALIVGAVIGGTAGVLIAIAGAAVGLYGLYNFIQ